MDPDRLRLRQPCSQVRSPVTTTMHPALRPFASTSADYRGEPLLECVCGCDMFIIIARFDPETRLPGFYLTDALCAACGSLLTAPTPIDEGHEVYG